MTAGDWRLRLKPGLAALKLDLPAGSEEKLLAFVELLQKWNRAYNLTAVRDPEEMLVKHVLDSLAVLPYVVHGPVLDVGTGAGLPGIPLAVAQPDMQFTLLDGNGKKARFVTHAAGALGLANVTAVQSRVEDYRPESGFATVLSRAFASLGDFLRLAGHAAAPGGRLLAMKGAHPEQELADIPAGYKLLGVHTLEVPGLKAERCVVEIEKS
ncbi:MAG TPA: 16S rRNA (guanine(527)-N(7))-methyltransferase RsmG [Gammaproteobacteria bacterium]|nr:16S rRNA (guanine(527)-N(7))-methyltransferase RsmG [Gammaproteobacteria bacterium]